MPKKYATILNMIHIYDKKGFSPLLSLDADSLSNIDLQHAELHEANLIEYNLSHADLRGAILTNADLRFANLSHADLRGTNLTDADLSNANLDHALLDNAVLNNTILTNTTLPESFKKRQPTLNKLQSIPVKEEHQG